MGIEINHVIESITRKISHACETVKALRPNPYDTDGIVLALYFSINYSNQLSLFKEFVQSTYWFSGFEQSSTIDNAGFTVSEPFHKLVHCQTLHNSFEPAFGLGVSAKVRPYFA